MNKDFVFYTLEQNKINVTVYGIERLARSPVIIYAHGFKGFKDWGFVPCLAEYFAYFKFCVITFNFSHNGIGENPLEFTEIEQFAENTFSLELSELEQIIEAYQFSYFGNPADKGIFLLGHSRGGGISILAGSNSDEISGVVTWASVSHFDRYSDRQKEEWRKKGVFEVLNSRTKQVMKLNVSLLEDIEENMDVLDIQKAAETMNKPFLIIHGDQDVSVPLKEAQEIYECSDKENTELFVVPHTGHTFDMVHPFEGTNKTFETVLNKTLEFLKNTEKEVQMFLKPTGNASAVQAVFTKFLELKIHLVISFTLLTAIAAQIVIPVQPVPFTLQTLAVLLSGIVLGSRYGAYTQLTYLTLGILGLPVFAPMTDFSIGFARILGPTGGYLLAFPVGAFLAGYVYEKRKSFAMGFISLLLGETVITFLGVLFLNTFYLHNMKQSFFLGASLFSIWTVAKVVIAPALSLFFQK